MRILLVLVVLIGLFVALVFLQDQPPVAQALSNLPPQVAQTLQKARSLLTGQTTISTPTVSPQAQQTLDKVGQTLENAGEKTGEEAKKIEGEIQQQMSTNSAPQPVPPAPPADQTPAPAPAPIPDPNAPAPAPAPAPTPAPAQ